MIKSESQLIKNKAELYTNFFEKINHPEFSRELTPFTPWAYFTLEIYGQEIKGGGGLGILAGDILETTKKINLPTVFITPFYPKERKACLKNFYQEFGWINVNPQERGFENIGEVEIKTNFGGEIVLTKLNVFQKKFGNVKLLTLSEENFGYLYQDANNSDHRLYQEIALGFGGAKILEQLKIEPRIVHINEAAAVFGAVALLDKLISQLGDFEKSCQEIKRKTIYTNHTLVPAAEPVFSLNQFERFVFPNILNEEVINWIKSLFENGYIRLSKLAIELSSKKNGVSRLHANESRRFYYDKTGKPVDFLPVTNGISLDRWADPEILNLYRQKGILTEFDLLFPDFEEKINNLDDNRLLEIKEKNRRHLRDMLSLYDNQYGEKINIPQEGLIFVWKRRIAGYKRPGLVFSQPEKLAEILEQNNGYLILAGEVHPNDEPMKQELKRILNIIDSHSILRKRVHFIFNYNPEISKALSLGADISLNTPQVLDEYGRRVSTEACGTSWEKDILGNTILISVSDGGIADWELSQPNNFNKPFLEIKGKNQDEEIESLYENMKAACLICRNNQRTSQIKKQLKAYLPQISDTRMIRDYLEMAFK